MDLSLSPPKIHALNKPVLPMNYPGCGILRSKTDTRIAHSTAEHSMTELHSYLPGVHDCHGAHLPTCYVHDDFVL